MKRVAAPVTRPLMLLTKRYVTLSRAATLYRNYRMFLSPERLKMRRTVARWIRSCEPDSRIMEVGGGTAMIRSVIQAELPGTLFFSGDIAPTDQTDVALDALALPIATGSLDAVIALEVLEHMPDPEGMLREASRVLKPTGIVILTTPFMFGVHDFRDYFRYTPLGLSTLLGRCGLTLSETVLRGGTFVASTGLVRNFLVHLIVGDPAGWRATGRRNKVLWLVATGLVLTPWTVVTWGALVLDRVVDRSSLAPPGYFFLCHKAAAATEEAATGPSWSARVIDSANLSYADTRASPAVAVAADLVARHGP